MRLAIGLALMAVVQTVIWQGPFTDEQVWTARVGQLYRDLGGGFVQGDNPVYSGHPGTPILLLGSLAMTAGWPAEIAVRISTIILMSIGAVLAMQLAYQLNSVRGWWLVVGLVSALWAPYAHSSPTNAVAAIWMVVLTLGAINLCRRSVSGIWPWLAWGGVWGLLLVTRIETGAIIGFFWWLLLTWRWGFKKSGLMAGAAAAAAIFLDPLLWFTPIDHITYVLWRSSLNFTEAVATIPLSVTDFFLHAPLSLLGLGLTFISLWLKPTGLIWKKEIWWMILGATMVLVTLLLLVKAQSLRHFQPLLLWWELVAALWTLHWIEQSHVQEKVIWQSAVVILFIGMNAGLLVQAGI